MRLSLKILLCLLLGCYLLPLSTAAEISIDVHGEIGTERTESSSSQSQSTDDAEDRLAEPNESVIEVSHLPKTGATQQHWSIIGWACLVFWLICRRKRNLYSSC